MRDKAVLIENSANKIKDLMTARRTGKMSEQTATEISKLVDEILLLTGEMKVASECSIVTALEDLRNEVLAAKTHIAETKTALMKTTAPTPSPRTYAGATNKLKTTSITQVTTKTITSEPPQPQLPSLVFTTTNPNEDPMTVFKKTFPAKTLKIMPIFTKLGAKSVRATFTKTEDRDELKYWINSTTTLKAEDSRKRRPLVALKGIPAEVPQAELIETILAQNDHIAKTVSTEDAIKIRFTRKNRLHEDAYDAILEVTPKTWAAIIDDRVAIGYLRVHSETFTPFTQCYKCLGFGHTKTHCTKTQRCSYCAEDHHIDECPHKKAKTAGRNKCYNCVEYNKITKTVPKARTDHEATSKTCPRAIAAAERANSSVDYGL